jgi:hypothetical protein
VTFPQYIGIDPGIKGAIAFYDAGSENYLRVFDMPTTWGYERKASKSHGSKQRRSQVDAVAVADIFSNFTTPGSLALIEEVHAMPNDGGVQAFAFGRSYGVVLGVLAAQGIVVKTVRPSVWKSLMNLSSDKSASIGKAVYQFPKYAHMFGRKMDDGRAEAAILAYFGHYQFGGL